MNFILILFGLSLKSTSAFQMFPPFFRSQKKPLYSKTIKSNSERTDVAAPTAQEINSTSSNRRVSLLVCPAQFCVPADYQALFDSLTKYMELGGHNDNDEIIELGKTVVAPLPRTEWIKVAKQLPTRNFLDATLPVHRTLDWYFDAIELGLAEIFSTEGPDTNVCIIGHSIGGWVARAYLGGLSRSSSAVSQMARNQCSSLITLGTPHLAPNTALVDQTRGLLREINECPDCSSKLLMDHGIDITCVASSGLSGKFLSTNVEELVAASSYLPLLGRVGVQVKGDGIVPLELAFMDPPARAVELKSCSLTGASIRHSHVLPTPWNLLDGYAPSISLPDDFISYTSEGVIPQWAKYIR